MAGIHLIIDGNYILYKNLFALHKSKTLYTDLQIALKSNLSRCVNILGRVDKIWTVVDSKISWRKQYYPTYKADRKKDDTIDWNWVWSQHKEFLDNSGTTVLQEDGLEGDDIVAILTEKINKEGGSCLILSDDKDFRQLVKWGLNSSDEAFINIMWNDSLSSDRERIIVPHNINGFSDYIKSNRGIDVLFSGHDWEGDSRVLKVLDRLKNKNTVYVDHNEVVFRKLLEGDSGDGVDSVYHETQNLKDGGTREVGIGESTSQKIWDKFKDLDLPYTEEPNLELMANLLLDVKKQDNNKKEEIIEKLKINQILMILKKGFIPNDLWEKVEMKIS